MTHKNSLLSPVVPFQVLEHGEVFVTQDGTETDLDIGYYERFTGLPATTRNSTTCGKCLQKVFDKERRGDLLGATVQMTMRSKRLYTVH